MARPKKQKQQTLEATLCRPRVKPAVKTPKAKSKRQIGGANPASSSPVAASSSPRPPSPSSFMGSSQVGESARKKRIVVDDSSSSDDRSDEDEVTLPFRETRRGRKHQVSDSVSREREPADEKGDDNSDDEDGDDQPLVTPKSKTRTRRKRPIALESSDEDEEPLASSPIKRRRLVRGNAASSPTEGDQSDEEPEPAPSSVRSRRTRRKPRTKKEKALELLRRKRAGEKLDQDEESTPEDEEPAKPMYDTDSDNPALDEFEDDEEGVPEFKEADGKQAEKKGKQNAAESDDDDSAESDDFVVEDDDAPLGMPDDVHMEIPLEFTAHSHKPLKEHFRDAIEWLVQYKINPGFERNHALYRLAFRRLNDEISGLAQSKFSSAAWKTDFTMALRARPGSTSQEWMGDSLLDLRNCDACGRSGHPAKFIMTFSGKPYYKDTSNLDTFLDPVEPDSDSSSGGARPEHEEEDEDGNAIPEETKEWYVGAVCQSNAQTAHDLIHWKHSLLDWVDARLMWEGWMAPNKLAERERMTPKAKYKLVDKILKSWVDSRVIRSLFEKFKAEIEQAKNKPTTGRYGRR